MSIEEVARACKEAGFEGDALVTMIAIGGAESGWNPDAVNDTRRYSERREDGLWYDPATGEHLPPKTQPENSHGWAMINLNAHPWVSEAEAHDYDGAAQAVYAISNEGRDFWPWSTFQRGLGDYYALAAQEVQRVHNLPAPAAPEPLRTYLSRDLAMGALVAAAQLVHGGDDTYIEENGPDGLWLAAFLPRAALDAEWNHVDELLPE